jgi:hypothetical protein
MLPTDHILKILGAAEGSWYRHKNRVVDKRYVASFASSKSGLSFGIFQHDVYANKIARDNFQVLLSSAIASKVINPTEQKLLYDKAKTSGAVRLFTPEDIKLASKILNTPFSKGQIDKLDASRAVTFPKEKIEPIMQAGLKHWQAKQAKNPSANYNLSALTEGTKEYARFYAYLLASMNKREKSQSDYIKWVTEDTITMSNKSTLKQSSPPTLEALHAFLSSLQVWTGKNGSYKNLRERLDPVLDELGY